jgi:hypothetical protein
MKAPARAVLACAILGAAACSSTASNKSSTSTTVAAAASTTTAVTTAAPATATTAAAQPKVGHVFVIMLENESSSSTFGAPANDPYLATTLTSEGEFVPGYYAVGHVSLDNYIAFISGQPPNSDTQLDCIKGYDEFPSSAGQATVAGASGIQQGAGCLYPTAVTTLANQLAGKGLTWKAYMEDMGNNPVRDNAPTSVCGHPVPNHADPTEVAASGDGYASRHDPFVYFHSIIDSTSLCANVVPLGSASGAMPPSDTAGATGLAADLKSTSTTPAFSFITPNLCDDGHDYPCRNQASPASSALADIDSFLSTWVPLITSSPAFKQDGLLMVAFDEASDSDTTLCCGEVPGPGAASAQASGGGKVGALLISPFIKGGTTLNGSYNHYSSLATFEQLFGLPRLGDAQTVTSTFTSAITPPTS